MGIANPPQAAQENQFEGRGSGPTLVAMVLLGLAGLAINVSLPLTISWGVHMLFGGSVALLAVRLLPTIPALGSVLLTTLPTVLLWGHWLAVANLCCEAICLCLAARRGRSMVGVDLAYWLAVGCPASILGSLAWGEAPLEVAVLIAAKLGFNGLVNASIAEVLFLASLRARGFTWLAPMRKPSASVALVATLSCFVAVPGLAGSVALSLFTMRGVEREMRRALADYEADAVASVAHVLALADGLLGNVAPQVARQAEANSPVVRKLAGPAPWETIILLDASWPVVDPTAACWAATLRERLVGADMTADRMLAIPAQGPCEASLLAVRALEDKRLAVLRASSAMAARLILEQTTSHAAREGHAWLAGVIADEGGLLAMSGSAGIDSNDLPSSLLRSTQSVLPGRDLGFFKREMRDWAVRSAFELSAIPGWQTGIAFSSQALRAEAQRAQAAILVIAFALVCGAVFIGSKIATAVGQRLRFSAARSGEADDRTSQLPLEEMDLLEAWIRNIVEELRAEHGTSGAFRARLEAFEAIAPVITYVAEDAPERGSPVLAYSPSMRRVLDVDPAVAAASGWLKVNIHPDDWARVQATFSAADGSPGMSRATYRLRGADGRYRWFTDTRVKLADCVQPPMLHGLMLEVTDQKEAERQLVQAAKLAQIGELAVSMGHELSQPLNVIKLAASNLQAASEDGPVPSEQLAVRLDRIVRQVDKATSLLSHLKVFGRQASEQAFAPLDLAGLVDDALLVLRGTLAQAGIAVVVDVRASKPMAHGSALLVEQCLVNLLANAADAIGARREREPGLVGRIEISISGDGQFLHINVADNGGGIPPEVQGRVFEPFFTTKPPGKGTGLGLSISRRAMQEMGGSLRFANEGEGAVFTIAVPRAQAPDQGNRVNEP